MLETRFAARPARVSLVESAVAPCHQNPYALSLRNLVSDAGRVRVGSEYIPLEPTGVFEDVAQIGELLISDRSGNQIRLRDIAAIRRGYTEPPREILLYDGRAAIGIGISTVAGGNVVEMGDAIRQRLTELRPQIPLGVEFGIRFEFRRGNRVLSARSRARPACARSPDCCCSRFQYLS